MKIWTTVWKFLMLMSHTTTPTLVMPCFSDCGVVQHKHDHLFWIYRRQLGTWWLLGAVHTPILPKLSRLCLWCLSYMMKAMFCTPESSPWWEYLLHLMKRIQIWHKFLGGKWDTAHIAIHLWSVINSGSLISSFNMFVEQSLDSDKNQLKSLYGNVPCNHSWF